MAEAKKFLEDYKSKVNETDSTGWTALHWACSRGKEDMVKLLLENDAIVNVVTEDNWAPIHDAARSGSEPVVRLLKEAGADMDVKTKNGSLTLHFAAQYDRVDVMKFLLSLEDVKVDAQNQAGHTAVHVAARYGKENVVKVLLEARANVLLKDKINRTAMQLAEEHGFHSLGLLLEEEVVTQEAQSINNAEIAMKDAEEAVAMEDKFQAIDALEQAIFLYNLCAETEKAKKAEDQLAQVRTMRDKKLLP